MKKHVKIFLEANGYDATMNFGDMFIPCNQCGARAVDIDHIENRQMGGSKLMDIPDNLQALCRSCHLKKTQNRL